jgi:hypothetical protein
LSVTFKKLMQGLGESVLSGSEQFFLLAEFICES